MPSFQELRLEAGLSVSVLSRKANVDYKTAKRADDGKPIQQLKAVALLKVLSEAMNKPLTVQDVEGLQTV